MTTKSSTAKPTILTAAMAREARVAREALRPFALTATRPGVVARVRLVDLNDADQLFALPAPLVRHIVELSAEGQRHADLPVEGEDGLINVERAVGLARADAQTRDAYCLAGFVEPPLIREEGERTSPAQVVVSDLHPADRQRFFELCRGAAPDDGPDEGDIPVSSDEATEPVERDAAA